MPELSIVVPCFNEAANLPELLRRFDTAASGASLELILVNNGSSDETHAVLERELPERSFARVVTLPRNAGYGGGIMAGLAAARGETLAWTHADLQTPPEDVLAAHRRLRELGPRILVKGRRLKRATKGEALVSAVYAAVASAALGLPALDVNGQPKVFGRGLLEEALRGPADLSYDLYVLWRACQLGWTIEELDVRFEPRRRGESKWATSPASRARAVFICLARAGEFRLGRWPAAGSPRPAASAGP